MHLQKLFVLPFFLKCTFAALVIQIFYFCNPLIYCMPLVFSYLQFLSYKSHKLYVSKEKFVRPFIHFYFKCYSRVSRMARAAAACRG